MTRDYFSTLARYNRWANRRLYAAVAQLKTDEYFRQRPAFFKSIHGTLNHLLVCDRIWFGRILDGQGPLLKLDQILYGDLVALRVAREAEDERIITGVSGMDPARFGQNIEYRNTSGQRFNQALDLVLGHVFNHQTHHRGQAHDQLSQTNVAPPPLDLIMFMREGGGG